MFVYNVTTHVEPSIEQQWLQWMQNEHLPEMLQTGHFSQAKLYRVVTEQDQGGISYATQYSCESRKNYTDYLKQNATQLQQQAHERFGNKILSFRTELEQIIRLA
ncbi:MAG: DUF4286 family protein [Flavobacteriaceae bacterium]